MKKAVWGAALIAAAAAQLAIAGSPTDLEPAVHLAWQFGAHADAQPKLSLGLYPSELGWRRMWHEAGVSEAGMNLVSHLQRPALLEWRTDHTDSVSLLGLPVNRQFLQLNEDGEKAHSNWGWHVGEIVLAAGAAVALIVTAGGNAAEKNNPAVKTTATSGQSGGNTGVGQDGVGCVNGQCVVPCGSTGPVNQCNSGG